MTTRQMRTTEQERLSTNDMNSMSEVIACEARESKQRVRIRIRAILDAEAALPELTQNLSVDDFPALDESHGYEAKLVVAV